MRCLIVLVLFICGCQQEPAVSPEQDKATGGGSSKSSVELLVDGVTGAYAVEAGRRAKADIAAASERHEANLAELLEE